MAKLQRKSAKLFAEEATASAGGLAQFGSLAEGTPNYSTDPDVIQALDAYKEGWSSAVLGTKSPALEDRNALDYLLSYQQKYIMQHGIPEWLDTETYYENCYVVDSNGELRVSTIDDNTGHDPIEDEGGQYWGYAGARGSGKQIGEVYYSQSNLASENKGALPLFTGELISNAENLYPQFYAWVLSHAELCKTQAQYDTAISTYGECPFYVIDDTNKTIRLPKLVNYVKMAKPSDGITQSSAGLPNITGTVRTTNGGGDASGAFVYGEQGAQIVATTQAGVNGFTLDASRSSSVYGNSNTVTPAHTTLYPWVCAYNGAAPASIAQAAEFQQALSSKVDLASGVDQEDVDYVVDSYSNGNSWYRVWKSGWCEQGGFFTDETSIESSIVFLKEMADTNYTALALIEAPSDSGAVYFQLSVYSRATTGMTITHSVGSNRFARKFSWEVKGYKAS